MTANRKVSAITTVVIGLVGLAPSLALAQVYGEHTDRIRSGAPEKSLRFSSEGLAETRLPSGGVSVNLEGRFRHYLVAQTGPDGELHIGCTADPLQPHEHDAPAARPVE